MLFARTNTGAIQTWTIEVDVAKYRTHYGQLDSDKIQTTEWTVCEGKNTGKKNATSAEDQSVKEANATWKKKKESGYFEKLMTLMELALLNQCWQRTMMIIRMI